MAKGGDRFTPSTQVEGASAAASRSVRSAMAVQPESVAVITPILPDIPRPPPSRTRAASTIERIRREIMALALRATGGEEVYLDVLDVRTDFEVLSVREASDEEIAFDGRDARGHPAKAVQHYTRVSYFLRLETPLGKRERIGFAFATSLEPGA